MRNHKKFFYFDIETSGRFKSFKSFEENDSRGAATFKRKWQKMYDAKSANWRYNIETAWRRQSPLMPEFGIVLCMSYGFVHPQTEKFIVKTVYIENDNELNLMNEIATIFNKLTSLHLIPTGHNIKGFDVPFIVKKLMMHGIKIPDILNTYNKKPWEVAMVDTADVWKGLAWEKTSLDEITYALDVPTPKTTLDGAHVFETYWVHDGIEQIVEYCERDVIALFDICEKIYPTLQ